MLPKPARYFPLEKGLYEVAPGLRGLNQKYGNGESDALVFQIDSDFPRYRENKEACRKERLSKYHGTADYDPKVSTAVNRWMVERLAAEHPKHFQWRVSSSGDSELQCRLTGETLSLNGQFELATPCPPYISAFDALCSQVQEDIAVVSAAPNRDWLSAIHLCSPGHWAAEDKIGRDFVTIHAPVAGIDKVNKAARSLVEACITKGPYVRFVWGFGTDRRLNHHPVPPSGFDAAEWKGRTFRPEARGSDSPFILRVERQVLWGLPEVRSFVFTIRISFIDGEEIRRNPTERELLRSGLLSMTPESRVYKGLSGCMDEVIAWLSE